MKRPFHPGQKIPLDEAFYVEREIDSTYIEELRARASNLGVGPHLHGTRQSGKSSLILRAKSSLTSDHQVLVLDLASRFPPGSDPQPDGKFWQDLAAGIAFEFEARDRPPAPTLDELTAVSTPGGFHDVLIALARGHSNPLILIVDELDTLSLPQRAALCATLRAILQDRSDDPSLRVNVSLSGVWPPVPTDDSPRLLVTQEGLGGDALWLDDFAANDQTAEEVRRAYREYAEPAIEMPLNAARELLAYSGGYPRALSWLGNCVADACWESKIEFDASFAQRLRELVAAHIHGSDAARPATQIERAHALAWMRVIENYFIEAGSDQIELHEALQLHSRLLTVDAAADIPPAYEPREPAHQLLRFSGLARRDSDGRIRIRSQLFADAFDESWVRGIDERIYWAARSSYQRRPGKPGRARYESDKKLLVIGTGGTVGMAENLQGEVRPDRDSELVPEWLFDAEEMFGRRPDFVPLFEPPLDSADVGPAQWQDLAERIVRARSLENYSGVVVAHGTDTLAYTASAIGFALGSALNFPVVFTGSQTTIDVAHGDAKSNLLRALLVATQELNEVVVTFGEKIFRATRTQKKDDLRFDAFESPGYPELGFVAEEVQIFHETLLPSRPASGPITERSTSFASGILNVSQLPGSEAAFYEMALEAGAADGTGHGSLCNGIIIQSLGAGNIPTVTPEFALDKLIGLANKRGIPVILTSQYPVLPANYQRYSPSATAIEAGAIPTGNMTVSAVVAKLSWVLPQVDAAIERGLLVSGERMARVREMMEEEYVGEGGLSVYTRPVLAPHTDGQMGDG